MTAPLIYLLTLILIRTLSRENGGGLLSTFNQTRDGNADDQKDAGDCDCVYVASG